MRRQPRVAVTLILAVFVGHAVHGADPKRGWAPTVRDWINLKGAGKPAISPDGRLVAYPIRSADWEAESFDNEVWVADVASGQNYQLTDAKGWSWAPAW